MRVADLGTYPEDQKEIDFWVKQMATMDKRWKTKNGLSVDVSNEEYLEWWETYFQKNLKKDSYNNQK